MITIDEEVLFEAIKGLENHECFKAILLACENKGKLIKPCKDCQFRVFYDVFMGKHLKENNDDTD